MGGRGSGAGLNKGGAETRQLTSLANAPSSDFVKNKVVSEKNTSKISEAQQKLLLRKIEDKKKKIKTFMEGYNRDLKDLEKRRGEKIKGTLSQKMEKAMGIIYNEPYKILKREIKKLSDAKKTKFANKAIDILSK